MNPEHHAAKESHEQALAILARAEAELARFRATGEMDYRAEANRVQDVADAKATVARTATKLAALETIAPQPVMRQRPRRTLHGPQ